MKNTAPAIYNAAAQPSFPEQTALDVDALATKLRAALQQKREDRQQGRYRAPAIDLSGGNPDVMMSAHQARAVLRAVAPLALTTGKSRLKTGRLSTEIADFLGTLAACGRGVAGNPHDLPAALAAGVALSRTLNAALDELRWKQATTAAGVAWKRPEQQLETSRDVPIIAILRQSTAAKQARKKNSGVTKITTQPSLLLPIGGGKPQSTTARQPEQAAATPPPVRRRRAARARQPTGFCAPRSPPRAGSIFMRCDRSRLPPIRVWLPPRASRRPRRHLSSYQPYG